MAKEPQDDPVDKSKKIERIVEKVNLKGGGTAEVITELWTTPDGDRFERVTLANGKQVTTKHAELKYFWGRFQAASGKGDQQIIKVWHKGAARQWKRMELVIVPSTYLHVCGIANQERFSMIPGEPLKRLAPYNQYGFTIDMTCGKQGEATAEEYEKRMAEGTEKNKQLQLSQTMSASPAGTQ
jgi:hypothetical protein